MGALLLSVSALICSLFILLAGNSLQFVILGLRAESEGFSLAVIGALTAGYYVGYAAGSLAAPSFVDRVGHIRAFAALSSVISAVVLAHGLWVDPVFWVALRVITGLCFAGLATVAESWLNARATRDLRGRLLSIASMAVITGYAIGPLFAALGSVDGLTLFVLASILMSVALVPVTVTRFPAPSLSGDGNVMERYTIGRLFKETPLGLVGCVITGATQGAFLGLGAVFGGRIGLSDTDVTVFMAGALAAGALAQYPLGWLSDRIDRRLVIAASCGLIGCGAFAVMTLLYGVGATFPVVVLAAVVAGASAMPLYPIVIAFVNDRLPEPSIVPAAATLILCFSLGSAIAGQGASLVMDLAGPAGLFGFLGAAMVVLAAFTALRMVLREAPDQSPDGGGVVVPAMALAPLDETVDADQLSLALEDPPPDPETPRDPPG